MAKEEMVRIRIKRFGKNWATCGVGVRPPEHLVGDPRMKRLCPKLVPGQVIELPADHSLLTQRKLIERVDGPEHDEFMRPWVFKTAADAGMANPSKSRLGVDQIMTGLALADGAINNQGRKLEERKALQDDYRDSRPSHEDKVFNENEPQPEYEDEELEELEDEKTVAKRARNSVSRKIKTEAVPIEDDEEDPPAPPVRTPARRRRRATSD
jgi:hypothetical protein